MPPRNGPSGRLIPVIEPSGILNKELADKGEYESVANDLMMNVSTRPRPREVVMSGGQSIIEEQFEKLRLKRPLKKWRQDMAESFLTPYIYAISETWHELDRSQATALVDRGLDASQAYRKGVGFEPIDLADQSQRGQYAVLGLGTTRAAYIFAPEQVRESEIAEGWTSLYRYLIEQPSYQRIDLMNETHELLAPMLVKEKHVDEYQKAHRVSWSVGIAVGFLDILGELP